jgi:hypothetical protein
MKIRSIVLLAFLVLTQGCVYSIYTTELDTPIRRPEIKDRVVTQIFSSVDERGTHSVSIGDVLFVVKRYSVTTTKREVSQYFPKCSGWVGTHNYNDGKSGDLIVYTSIAYHRGDVGVILDDNDQLATAEPLVQLKGDRSGRRWAISGNASFFRIAAKETRKSLGNPWALRYGGVTNDVYTFEIINQSEPTVVQILQTIKVTENDFLSGFTVRDVFVKGVQPDKHGIICFELKDSMTSDV